MPPPDRTRTIAHRTPESAAMVADLRRASTLLAQLNRLGFNEADEVRGLVSLLTGQPLDAGFLMIPPFYTTGGGRIRLGRDVFINQNCTFHDLGGIEIGDGALIGPNVSLITSGHPLDPATRRTHITASPIVIGKGAWLGAGAIVLGGVTVGEDAVVGAGAVVTKDVPAGVVVAGNPAGVVKGVR